MVGLEVFCRACLDALAATLDAIWSSAEQVGNGINVKVETSAALGKAGVERSSISASIRTHA